LGASTTASYGCSVATGAPWRVMTITSPASTRSSSSLRRVLASNAPTVAEVDLAFMGTLKASIGRGA
jgi:hypothetical protein